MTPQADHNLVISCFTCSLLHLYFKQLSAHLLYRRFAALISDRILSQCCCHSPENKQERSNQKVGRDRLPFGLLDGNNDKGFYSP